MKTARGHRDDRAVNSARVRNWRHPIGTQVRLRDGTVTRTWSHAGRDCYGSAVVFVEGRESPVELIALEVLPVPSSTFTYQH